MARFRKCVGFVTLILIFMLKLFALLRNIFLPGPVHVTSTFSSPTDKSQLFNNLVRKQETKLIKQQNHTSLFSRGNLKQNCQVRIKNHKTSPNLDKPLCSWRNYQEEVKRTGYFPGEGEWRLSKNGSEIDSYHPTFCRLNLQFFQPDYFKGDRNSDNLLGCFREKKWKYISVVGQGFIGFKKCQ